MVAHPKQANNFGVGLQPAADTRLMESISRVGRAVNPITRATKTMP